MSMDHDLAYRFERECVALSNAFAYHIDHRNYRELADLFAPDGVWVRLGVRFEGQAAILDAMAQRPDNQFTRHVTTGHHFTRIDESSAAAFAYNISYYS